MKPLFAVLFILFFFHPITGPAQSAANDHSVYLLSNLESLPADAPELTAVEQQIQNEKGDFTILITGDFVDENGLGSKPNQDDIDKLDRLINMSGTKGKIVFVPGDREWDNGGKRGLKKLKSLEKYLESKLGKGQVFFPQKGCLGPEVIDIGEHLRIVAINTQWMLEENKRPEEEDADCGLLNETEFWYEIEDMFDVGENRNVIIAGHHPVLSYGQYAGYRLGAKHILPPIIGSFITGYHQSVGGKKDLSRQNIKAYSSRMLGLTQRFQGGIFVSGHEYDTQLLFKNNNYHINSGALAKGRPVGRGKETLYKSKHPGFVKLLFAEDGEVTAHVFEINDRTSIKPVHQEILFESPCKESDYVYPKNILYAPCQNSFSEKPSTTNVDSLLTVVPGAEYKAGLLKRMLLGKHYRTSWTQPIANIPYLNLDTTYGGLNPTSKGGGAQTVSLKFKSKDGLTFAFRSVNKNPTQRMDKDLRPGVYGKITQDKTSHQHPLSSTIMGPFMDRLGLPHSRPKLYVMPDDPRLGAFREEFAGMLGTLELKPKGKSKKKKRKGFRGADDVESTMQMYKRLIDDNDNYVDVDQFVKARLLDIWVADWDRHFNNFKWLVYKDGKQKKYSVFPKDRDKSLSLYEGVYKFIEIFHLQRDKSNFRKNYYGLKYLNNKNKTMDRWLANSYTYEDWQAAVDDFQKQMTDEAIADAIDHLPVEMQGLVRKRMTAVLKSRRAKLPKAINRYYKLLAKQIDLIGSNSKEIFELQRLENGDVQANIYKLKKNGEKGRQLFSRLIKRKETKEIRLHGLGKDDRFLITGTSKKSILIRIIGGKGEDQIIDESKVSGLRKMTRVYDKRNTDELTLNTEAKKKNTDEILTFKSDQFFQYDYLNVLPSFAYNTDDGFVIGLTGTYTSQKFNKPDFGQKYNFSGFFTTNGSYNLSVLGQYREIIHNWDGLIDIAIDGTDRSFRNFYGLSNENVIDDDLRDADFYENESSSLRFHLGLQRSFWNKSSFSFGVQYHGKDVEKEAEDGAPTIYNNIDPGNGLGGTNLLGPRVELTIDFRNSGNFPTKGVQLRAEAFHFYNTDTDFGTGGRLLSELSTFFTAGIKFPVTLALRGGVESSYGDVPFYYKAYLGQQNNLRGFVRNRFGGDTAVYSNNDLRFHLGKVITPLVPIKYGVFGLFDTGRTWRAGESSDQWHYTYGGGIYIIPYAESFNLIFTGAQNEEGDFLFSFRVGFFVR